MYDPSIDPPLRTQVPLCRRLSRRFPGNGPKRPGSRAYVFVVWDALEGADAQDAAQALLVSAQHRQSRDTKRSASSGREGGRSSLLS